jgi:hypothetical protein
MIRIERHGYGVKFDVFDANGASSRWAGTAVAKFPIRGQFAGVPYELRRGQSNGLRKRRSLILSTASGDIVASADPVGHTGWVVHEGPTDYTMTPRVAKHSIVNGVSSFMVECRKENVGCIKLSNRKRPEAILLRYVPQVECDLPSTVGTPTHVLMGLLLWLERIRQEAADAPV